MKLSDKILEKFGRENIKPQSKWGKALKRGGVARTNELRRVWNLPRRDWREEYDIEEMIELMTQWLKTKKGTMRLWPEQATVLHDLYEYQGVFAPIAVGRGKALISLLAGTVLDSERPVLLVPAQLREQTKYYVIPEMKRHWRLPKNLKVIGYSEIQTAKNHDLLTELNPDLLILDEAHYVKNKNAARTKRVRRFIEEKNIPVVTLSGTMTRKSIMDYWRLLWWSLKGNAPLPKFYREVVDWSNALDSDIDEERRTPPGALLDFCENGDTPRQGYQKRLTQTPGVIASGESELGVSLVIRPIKLDVPVEVKKALNRLRANWETPNGDFITEAIDLWRHAREIALGFWYRWDPPAPKEWLKARKAWKKYVRDTLRNNRRGLDSESQVWDECKRKPNDAWLAYEEIEHTFKPNTVAEWIALGMIYATTKWLHQSMIDEKPGICWVEHNVFGGSVAANSGWPYFSGGKKDSNEILKARGPIIASHRAHGEGKNLQHYSRNLIVSPFPSGKTWEQVLGRTHREGQKSDEVIVDVFMYTEEHYASFNQALNDARYIQETTGAKQKLLYADIPIKGVRK